MDKAQIQKHLDRADRRIRGGREVEGLESGEPELPADEVGAEGAAGYRVPSLGVTASVYVFETWEPHAKAVEELRRRNPPESDDDIQAGTNGPVLIVGRAPTNGPDGWVAQMTLARIVGNFAGDE